MHRKVAAALLVAFALVAVGCGSSGPLTRAELVRRIEVACRDGQRKGRALVARRGGSNSAQQLRFISALAVSQRTVTDALDDLEAPDAARRDFETFRQGIADRLELIDQAKDAGPSGVVREMKSIEHRGQELTRDVQRAAERLGVRGCI